MCNAVTTKRGHPSGDKGSQHDPHATSTKCNNATRLPKKMAEACLRGLRLIGIYRGITGDFPMMM